MNYKQELIQQLAQDILANTNGRVFLSTKWGASHGFITNPSGSRVVCFQWDLGTVRFSGSYKSKSCGTGWVMPDISVEHVLTQSGLDTVLAECAPNWATRGERVAYTTLDRHMATYGASSAYVEVLCNQ